MKACKHTRNELGKESQAVCQSSIGEWVHCLPSHHSSFTQLSLPDLPQIAFCLTGIKTKKYHYVKENITKEILGQEHLNTDHP